MKEDIKYLIGAFAIIILLLFLAAYPYDRHLEAYPFLSGADTLGDAADVDTVEWQVRNDDLSWPSAWNQLSTYITAANKGSEVSVNYQLANETAWGWADEIRFRILSASGDTLTSGAIYIGNRAGALLLSVQPDTLGTGSSSGGDTTLYLVRLKGQ